MACGIAGLSVAADCLPAIKYAEVTPVRDETELAVDFRIEGAYPAYGNNDERPDAIAVWLEFMRKVRKHPTYRGAEHTQSVCGDVHGPALGVQCPGTTRCALSRGRVVIR